MPANKIFPCLGLRWLGLSMLAGALLCCAIPLSIFGEKLFDSNAQKQLTIYLNDVCGWIVSPPGTDAASWKNRDDNGAVLINADLTRTLLAGSEFHKNPAPLRDAALLWCDAKAKQQQVAPTAKGNTGGYWLDHGVRGDLDLTAAGGVAICLARASLYADGARKKTYLAALENYVRLVREGCGQDPLGKGRGNSSGWVIASGADKGALGRGYSSGRLSLKASTSATAMQVSLFCRLYFLTHDEQYRQIAVDGLSWLLNSRQPTGEPRFLEDGEEDEAQVIPAGGYLAEAIMAAYYLLGDVNLNQKLASEMGRSTRWLVQAQGEQGLWGEGATRVQSPRIAALLYWDFLFGSKNQQTSEALNRFWETVTNPVHLQSFGVEVRGEPTSLVGLAIAEVLRPGVTYK